MKLILKWVLLVAGLIGVVVLNYAILTSWHPMEYYWTLPGMLLSGGYSAVESVILFPAIWWIFTKSGLIAETMKFLGVEEES